jgi:hypothetical protein
LLCQQLDDGHDHNPTWCWGPRQLRAFLNTLLEGAQSSWEAPLLPLWNALLAQRSFQVGVVLVVRKPEAVEATLVSPRSAAAGARGSGTAVPDADWLVSSP